VRVRVKLGSSSVPYEVVAQGVEVRLGFQLDGEGFQGLSRVIFRGGSAVNAPYSPALVYCKHTRCSNTIARVHAAVKLKFSVSTVSDHRRFIRNSSLSVLMNVLNR
jgi:hypothetical protein